MNMILTPEQSKEARSGLEMDQATAARAIGQSRPVLSYFESRKMIAPEDMQIALRELYESSGHVFEELVADENTDAELDVKLSTPQPVSKGYYGRAGFMVPEGLNLKEADEIVTELRDIEHEFAQILEEPIEDATWFGRFELDADAEEQYRRLLYLGVRYLCRARALQGRPLPVAPCTRADLEVDPDDQAGYLSRMLTPALDLEDAEDDGAEEPWSFL